MIIFEETLLVKKIEHKDIPTKTGKNFTFTEVTLETEDKKPTLLVARLAEGMDDSIRENEKALFKITVTSYQGKDGRIWNNFVIMAKESLAEPKPMEPLETVLDDSLPF